MKKSFLLLVGLILLVFTACQNDELVNGGDGSQAAVSFKVQMPEGDTPSTRTAGDGTQVNRCIMEIYLGGKLYGTRQVAAISNNAATFNVKLVTSQTYDFVFWADASGSDTNADNHYKTTDGLQNITYMGTYAGNDETRDAFTGVLKDKEVTGAFNETVTLTRPFGQLNIKTTDLATINSEDLKPAKASLTFTKVYSGFNALTGETVGELASLEYGSSADVVDADGNLTLDYLFAPKEGQLLVDMKLTMSKTDGTKITDKALNNIPIQRNYQTNVTGSMLTASGQFVATVTPSFTTPAIAKEIIEVATVAEVAKALETYDNVVVTTALTQEATISLPKYSAADKAVSITLPKTNNAVTISYDTNSGTTNTNVPKELTITAPETTKLIIDAKQTTVYMNGKVYTELEAATADNTLVINDGVEVTKLTVKAGNVKVFGNGKISEIINGTGKNDSVYIYASSKAQLPNTLPAGFQKVSLEAENIKEALAAGKAYQLTEDADITGCNVTVPSDKSATLDLNGYTITAANKKGDNIMVYGNLVLKDSKTTGKIVASKDYNGGAYNWGIIHIVNENASATMLSGTISAVRSNVASNGQYGVVVDKGGDFTMAGGTIEAGWYAVSGNGTNTTQESLINIIGGKLISTADYAVYLPHRGTTTISGGTVYGAAGGVAIQRSTLNVEGNALITSKGTGNTGNWGDGTGNLKCAAINVAAKYGDCVVNIKGGTLTAEANALISEGTAHTPTINVTGGTFSDPSLLGHLSAGANVNVKLLKDYEGPGLGIFYGKNGSRATINVDLNNHAWNLTDAPLFGSTNTVNQYFHLEKDAFVTFKNGTIQPKNDTSAKMLIQNYCHLTLENVNLIGGSTCGYVISNNNGSCTISNSTITAATGKVAFDVYSYSSYPGVTVMVNNNSVINGKVEFGGDNGKKNGHLTVDGSVLNGNLTVDGAYYDSTNKNITVTNATFGLGVTGWEAYK